MDWPIRPGADLGRWPRHRPVHLPEAARHVRVRRARGVPMSASGGLLLIHAHPDDECFSTGGLIARSVAEGRRVDLVVCTGGEEGEIHDPDLTEEEARPRIAEIRAAELACSLAILGGEGHGKLHLHRLRYRATGRCATPQ